MINPLTKHLAYPIVGLFLLTLLTGCSSSIAKKTSKVDEPYQHISQKNQVTNSTEGMASFYSDKFNGNKTASGEIFSNKKLTAAHRLLPFGTQVRVIALWNNKSVIVRINDRGPFSKDRIIDISKDAATKIGLISEGVGKVKVEVLR